MNLLGEPHGQAENKKRDIKSDLRAAPSDRRHAIHYEC